MNCHGCLPKAIMDSSPILPVSMKVDNMAEGPAAVDINLPDVPAQLKFITN